MVKVLRYLKPIRKDVVLSMIFIVLGQLMTLVLPLLMSMIINNGIKNADTESIRAKKVSGLHLRINPGAHAPKVRSG